jgi:hypothetical protein
VIKSAGDWRVDLVEWWPMKIRVVGGLLMGCFVMSLGAQEHDGKDVPEPLQGWVDWVLWGDEEIDSPRAYDDAKKAFRAWPSELRVTVGEKGADFRMEVEVFAEAWMPLPGAADVWPVAVMAGEVNQAVVEREGRPAIRLGKGSHQLTGRFEWKDMPQKLPVPVHIGLVALSIDGEPVEVPARDEKGALWLKRTVVSDAEQKDYLGTKVHALLEDGIPLRWQAEVEMIVSGRSREEDIGIVLPAGWRLSGIQSQIPVALDDAGRMKAQVRAGRWTARLSAFRNDAADEVVWPTGSGFSEVLVAFRAKPEFRMVEISGAMTVDVSQVSFPDEWKSEPVYRWETGAPLVIDERVRGMGMQRPQGVTIQREWWLDEQGGGMTFRDRINGAMQQVWRLDAGEGMELGSMEANGDGQLITRHPETGALGVEVRDRDLQLEATGRINQVGKLSATGWLVDADDVETTLHLPPGWRLLALFGADSVDGDWLTAWTLLDLFLLLLFTLAVLRLWGWKPALLAFFAFGLAYHEPGAPKMLWLLLLIPLALLRVVDKGWAKNLLLTAKWVMVLVFVVVAVPFVKGQIQQAIYPQLEADMHWENRMMQEERSAMSYQMNAPNSGDTDPFADNSGVDSSSQLLSRRVPSKAIFAKGSDNMSYDPKTRIQTGPGVPSWTWREVSFGWNGPVGPGQVVTPVLVPQSVERVLSLVRVALLLALAACLLQVRRWSGPLMRGAVKAACVMGGVLWIGTMPAEAQFPEKAMLDELRSRLLKSSDAFPGAADVRHVDLKLEERKLTMHVEIHAAARAAVPLPGRLPAWSPVSVRFEGGGAPLMLREGGHVWVLLEQGVHRMVVEGLLPDLSDWQWTSKIVPRRVTVDAPGWNVGGLNAEGSMVSQLLFSRVVRDEGDAVRYERPNLRAVVGLERQIELGLVWQVRTVVRRLSEEGPAVSLRIPLLPGENVVSDGAVVKDGFVDVNLGANQSEVVWLGELEPVNELPLRTGEGDGWTERWLLVASPIWNVTMDGLAPVFEGDTGGLVPVWTPWPGEEVKLVIRRPEAVAGETITVDEVSHKMELGRRQRTSTLELTVRASLGDRMPVELPENAVADELTVDGVGVPVRMEARSVIVPVSPGEQSVSLKWKTEVPLAVSTLGEAVRLPVAAANVKSLIEPPGDRWVLWAQGPQRGPAVRFWSVLAVGLLAAFVLSRIAGSPLRMYQWMLLSLGLTQISLVAALIVVVWLFFLAWRGSSGFSNLPGWVYNVLQAVLMIVTLVALGVFIAIVNQGLLGDPEMFILGNGSSRYALHWYQARVDGLLAQPLVVSVSIWWYRLLMLLWALWLAASLVRWLGWGWRQFAQGGVIRRADHKKQVADKKAAPPPLPE